MRLRSIAGATWVALAALLAGCAGFLDLGSVRFEEGAQEGDASVPGREAGTSPPRGDAAASEGGPVTEEDTGTGGNTFCTGPAKRASCIDFDDGTTGDWQRWTNGDGAVRVETSGGVGSNGTRGLAIALGSQSHSHACIRKTLPPGVSVMTLELDIFVERPGTGAHDVFQVSNESETDQIGVELSVTREIIIDVEHDDTDAPFATTKTLDISGWHHVYLEVGAVDADVTVSLDIDGLPIARRRPRSSPFGGSPILQIGDCSTAHGEIAWLSRYDNVTFDTR